MKNSILLVLVFMLLAPAAVRPDEKKFNVYLAVSATDVYTDLIKNDLMTGLEEYKDIKFTSSMDDADFEVFVTCITPDQMQGNQEFVASILYACTPKYVGFSIIMSRLIKEVMTCKGTQKNYEEVDKNMKNYLSECVFAPDNLVMTDSTPESLTKRIVASLNQKLFEPARQSSLSPSEEPTKTDTNP